MWTSQKYKRKKENVMRKASRHWYTNETSHYETQKRDREYSNWGGNS